VGPRRKDYALAGKHIYWARGIGKSECQKEPARSATTGPNQAAPRYSTGKLQFRRKNRRLSVLTEKDSLERAGTFWLGGEAAEFVKRLAQYNSSGSRR